jgi:hypothetical protein
VTIVVYAEILPGNQYINRTGNCTYISAGRNLIKFFVKVSPLGLARVQWKFYLLFICLNFIDFIIIALFFPETKCKLLYLVFSIFW